MFGEKELVLEISENSDTESCIILIFLEIVRDYSTSN